MAALYTKQSCSEPKAHVASKRMGRVCLIRPSMKVFQDRKILWKVAAVMRYRIILATAIVLLWRNKWVNHKEYESK
jgi:hypothetical protein